MNLPPTACSNQGCARYAVAGGKCADHKSETSKKYHDSYAVKSERPYFKEYRSAKWKALRAARLRGNPICQLIENGVQCTAPAYHGHHIISPGTNFSLFYVWSNIVMLCRHHHDHRDGEQANDPRNFADSIGATVGGVTNRLIHPKHALKTTAAGMSLSCKLAGLPE